MSPFLYKPIYLAVTSVISYSVVLMYLSSSDNRFQTHRNTMLFPLLLSTVLIFWLGGRPLSGAAFGDTANYAIIYSVVQSGPVSLDINFAGEWLWGFIMLGCKNLGLGVHGFFTVIEAGYILSALFAARRFTPRNPLVCLLFMLTSLMFLSFGTNGIRNGLACNIMLLAMSLIFDNRYFVGGLLCIAALGIHRSVMLPICGMLAGMFVIRNVKYAIYIWLASIAVSLAVGNSIMEFFVSLGVDERMSAYNSSDYEGSFSKTGFRWDFLLYSAMPIVMGWYVCIKKKIRDDWYRTLCVTYCLCNAFWVLVIRAAFSNRFAYLSWFMYPVIIAYPLLNLPVWRDQDRNTAIILAAYCGFTLFMLLVYW